MALLRSLRAILATRTQRRLLARTWTRLEASIDAEARP